MTKDFHTLSMAEQQGIWLTVAQTAIDAWGLKVETVEWLGYTNNAVFKVVTERGTYVLRLHPPARIDAPKLQSELWWLDALRQQTDLLAPAPIAVNDDEERVLFTTLYSDLLPAPHEVFCTLFDYVEGDAKNAQDLTPDDMYRIGQYLGVLHTQGQVTPPSDFTRPRLDWEGLFGENSLYNPHENAHIITTEQLTVFDAVAERVRETMVTIGQGQEAFGLVHADMLAKNILFHEGDVRALDFEYCGWGYFLYDLTPLLWQLKSVRASDYQALEDAMWNGYNVLHPQPDGHRVYVEAFIAGRQLASCRWLAVNLNHPAVREVAPQLLAQRTDELSEFLDSGILSRQSKTL